MAVTGVGTFYESEPERLERLRRTLVNQIDKRDEAKARGESRVADRAGKLINSIQEQISESHWLIEHDKWRAAEAQERKNYERGGLSVSTYDSDGLPTLRFSKLDARGCTKPDRDARVAAESAYRANHPELAWPATSFAAQYPARDEQHRNYLETGRTPWTKDGELA